MENRYFAHPSPQRRESAPVTRPTADAEEKRWLADITNGDRQAFEALYRRYHPRLLRFCYRWCGQPEGLEEIVNDTMLVIWHKAGTYDPACRPSTWIFGIAYRKCLESLRQLRRNARLESIDSHSDFHHVAGNQDQETSDWVNSALMELSQDQKAVMELTYYFGMSYKEIAQIMGCPENTVKTRMFHARKKLQNILPRLAERTPGVDHDESA